MAGAEVGADFFNPWRATKARSDFIKESVDFIVFIGCLLNIDALNLRFIDEQKKKKPKKAVSRATAEERETFCRRYIKQILEDVFPPLSVNGNLIKYWVFPCPLFEFKKDKFKFAAYIYENLSRESQKISGKDPYIRIGSEGELLEIEDDVAIKTIGIITPVTSFFRAKVLSTPAEREITYQQLSSLHGPVPDLYIAGSFAATLNEVNPRTVPLPRPYVSIPSLSIKFTETVLQNTLGYAVLKLYPEKKNRAQYEVSFFPLDDAIELECSYTKKQAQNLKENERKVTSAIVDKMRLGTKVTIGKIENVTGLNRDQILKAVKGMKKIGSKIDMDLGEIKNPYRIIPKTRKDLTEYREGKESKRTIAAGACFHIPASSVDYDFIENDFPQILIENQVETLFIVGDINEGNKYDQDRKGELLDRFYVPQDQKSLAGYIVAAKIVLPVFKKRYEESHDTASSIIRLVTIPGNHDEVKNEPPLKSYYNVLIAAATELIFKHLTANSESQPVDYPALKKFIRDKIILLKNPSMYGSVGMLHEYSQSAEQSTGKVQKALKQFMVLSFDVRNIHTLLLANHHEENFSLLRIGDKTIKAYHLGTLKRFYSFESQRSKISEFGIAIDSEVFKNGVLARVDTKFIPSRIDFEMRQGAEFSENNRIRGIKYYEEAKEYLDLENYQHQGS